MAKQPPFESQLVPLADVAAATTIHPLRVEQAAGKDVVEWFDGRPAVTLANARRILAEMRAVEDEDTRRYLKTLDDQEREIQRMHEEAVRRAAEQERQRPTILRGVEVEIPGEPEAVQ